jgi:hypothetical protein
MRAPESVGLIVRTLKREKFWENKDSRKDSRLYIGNVRNALHFNGGG